MATAVIMPALGMAQDTGTLLQWYAREGEEVVKGEPLMDIATDKVDVSVEAPASGILHGISASPGDEVPVGETIALILEPGEAVPDSDPARSSQLPASPVARRIAAAHDLDLDDVEAAGSRIAKADVLSHLSLRDEEEGVTPRLEPASPKARRLAGEMGLDLASIQGSGPEGAVLVRDLPKVQLEPSRPQAEPASESGRLWQQMASRLAKSWSVTPQFYLVREINVTALVAWYQAASRRIDGLSYSDLLLYVCAAGLRDQPRINARWDGEAVRLEQSIGIGLAVSVDDGVVVPVIQNADRLKLGELSQRRRDLVSRARQGGLTPADMGGGTFTISNLGMFGVDAFSAIVNPPQAAILAVGRIADRVIAVDGEPRVAPQMTLTLSCDHRVLDGALAARFLGRLAEYLEEPVSLLE